MQNNGFSRGQEFEMTHNNRIIVLTCRNRYFGQGLKVWESVNLDRMERMLQVRGYEVMEYEFEEVARDIRIVQDSVVLYSSSQRPGYKDYIEDVLLAVQSQRNTLIPSFDAFRAHHNKGYQELLKQRLELSRLKGQYLSHSSQAKQVGHRFPVVLKSVEGAKSTGVSLVRTSDELEAKMRRKEQLSWRLRSRRALTRLINPRKGRSPWYGHMRPVNPFVIQEFVPHLKHDFKVLVFWDSVYVLKRETRPKDFRASGSGRFSFCDPSEPLLNYSLDVRCRLGTPMVSLDVCEMEGGYGLIEFQCVHFGPYTIMNAPFHYKFTDGRWKQHTGRVDYEEEIVNAVVGFLRSR